MTLLADDGTPVLFSSSFETDGRGVTMRCAADSTFSSWSAANCGGDDGASGLGADELGGAPGGPDSDGAAEGAHLAAAPVLTLDSSAVSVVQPGSILQVSIAVIFCAVYLVIQLVAKPFRHPSDDFLSVATSFAMLMVFIGAMLFKFADLTGSAALRSKM